MVILLDLLGCYSYFLSVLNTFLIQFRSPFLFLSSFGSSLSFSSTYTDLHISTHLESIFFLKFLIRYVEDTLILKKLTTPWHYLNLFLLCKILFFSSEVKTTAKGTSLITPNKFSIEELAIYLDIFLNNPCPIYLGIDSLID